MSEAIVAVGAPVIPIRDNFVRFFVDLSPEEMSAIVSFYLQETKRCYDAIAASAASPSGKATLAPLYDEDNLRLGEMLNSALFPSYVSECKTLRDLAFQFRERISEFGIEQLLRPDVYEAFIALRRSPEYDSLDSEARRLLDKLIQTRVRSGLDLPPDQREQARALMTEISTLSNKYNQCIQDEDPELHLTAEQLAGVPAATLAAIPRDEKGLFIVKPKEYPHCIPIARHCTVRETREAVQRARNSVGFPTNVERLAKIVNLRAVLARRLGFANHAENVLWENMLKSGEDVRVFLGKMREKLTAQGESERREILQMLGISDPSALIPPQDISFCQRRIEEERYAFDSEAVREYLPTEIVVPRVIQLLSGVLGLKAQKVKTNPLAPHPSEVKARTPEELMECKDYSLVREVNGEIVVDTWHEQVMAYRITDAATGDLHGFLLLDIYPRPGTYTHACCDAIINPCRHYEVDGGVVVRPALVTLLCNFSPPGPESPSLLQHDELCTLMHETGHAMHVMSSRTRYDGTSAFCIEQDAVELPSQAFEGFAWLRGSLKVLSHHYKTGESLPDDMIDRVIRSRHANQGLAQLRQIQLGLLDNTIHTHHAEAGDITADQLVALDRELRNTIALTGTLEHTCMLGSFGHLVGGYDARYYGYMYSNVASCDCFATLVERAGGDVEAAGLEEYIAHYVGAGREYRRELLAVGASRDARCSIRAYLGRDAEPTALLRTWGIEA